MRIIVCMKNVPDPEGPRDAFVINQDTLKVEPRGIPPLISAYDENALEAALRLKDANPGATVIVLSMGRRVPEAVMLKALAAGADELVKVEDEALDPSALDSFATAAVLAEAVRKLGFDLVATGRQAADYNDSQTGIILAHLLGLPVVTLARTLKKEDGLLHIERVIEKGYEVVTVPLPAVVMCSGEAGELRYPSMIQRREAKNKPKQALTLADLGLSLPKRRVVPARLFAPEVKTAQCTYFTGGSPAEAARSLALKLREDRIV